jgi:hypothetical protein
MWAGPNAPMLPPQGQPWTPPQPIRPRAGWYALPVTLILVAVVGFLLTLALNLDDNRVSDDPSAAGDAARGVTLGMVAGHDYFVYVHDGGTRPTACSVRKPGVAPIALELTRSNSWASSDYKSYRYAATFQAPIGGNAVTVTCQGTTGSIVVMPDDTSSFYLGLALIIGCVLGGLGIVAFIVIAVRRRNAKRSAPAATPPPPPAQPSYPQMPPPGPYGG